MKGQNTDNCVSLLMSRDAPHTAIEQCTVYTLVDTTPPQPTGWRIPSCITDNIPVEVSEFRGHDWCSHSYLNTDYNKYHFGIAIIAVR